MLSDTATVVLSWMILAGLAAAAIGRFLVYYRQFEYGLAHAPFHILNIIYTRIIWRTRIVGRMPLDRVRGAVIVCNHTCPMDPSFIQLASTRLPHWMVAREYYQQFGIRWISELMGAIPVNRGGIDTAATKAAIRYAQEGDLVGLFPEGKINDTPELLLPGRSGAALIALKAETPVIPCFIRGAPYDGTAWGCFLMPAKVTITIGEPIDISRFYGQEPDKPVLEELTRIFLVEIAKLAGVPNYQPRIAGRAPTRPAAAEAIGA